MTYVHGYIRGSKCNVIMTNRGRDWLNLDGNGEKDINILASEFADNTHFRTAIFGSVGIYHAECWFGFWADILTIFLFMMSLFFGYSFFFFYRLVLINYWFGGNMLQLLVAVKQCHENGVCHGKSWFNWIQPLIVNAMHWCYKFSFCCSRWYQVWECADYVLQLALPCWLCIFQTHLHSIWWPLRFLFFLWHWWTKTLLSCTWGFFFFLLLCLFYLFLLQLKWNVGCTSNSVRCT